MKYRKLTADGDYTFGSSTQNFHTGIQAIAQAVQTRLQLLQGTFWRDQEAGLPFLTKIAGTPGSPDNLASISFIIRQLVEETEGVTEVVAFSVDYDSQARSYSYKGLVQTIDSQTIPFADTLGV